jgi:hypothetical protein
MKHPIQLIIFLFCTATSLYAQPGGWSVATAACQFNMTMVAQIQVNGVPDHLLNNHIAVYSRGQIRGYATPVQISGQAFYFLSLCSDAYKGDTLYFRAFRGADNKVYESVDTVVFKHHLALGRISNPFPIRFAQGNRPLIYSLAAVNYAAGTCSDVLDVQASDQQNSEGSGLLYSIVGGVDAGRFSINPVTGVLSWNNFVPDIANPADNDMDNRYEVEVKVTDASNLSDVQRITVTVVKNAPVPPLVCPPNQTYLTNSNGAGDCGAEANRTGVQLPNLCTLYDLTYQLTGATTGSGSGQIPQIQSFYKGATTATYTMSGSSPSTCSFTVVVSDNEPPTATCPNAVTVSCASGFPAANSALVTGSDNCVSFSKNHVGDALPSNYSSPNRYNVVRTYRVTDAAGNSTTCTQTITVYDATQPVFTFVPANLTVQCNSVPAVGTATASDGCGGAVIVSYNGQTRTNGTCFDTYTLTRQWTATDLSGNTKTATQRISVIDTQKPNFTTTPANITVQCSAIPTPTAPVATDNCALNPTVVYNGQTRTNGACANAYTLTRRWTASDNCGNTRTISQRITVVDNGKPVLTVPPNVTIACNATPPAVGTPTASDGCTGNVTIAYLGQSTVSGACPGSYQIKRTWRATDVCGNSTAATQTIQVQDNAAPVFTSVPAPVTIACTQSLPPLLNPTATDNCGGYVQITFLGNVASGSGCAADYTVTRTWRAADLCGNTATATQVITVLGNNFGEGGAENRAEGTHLKTQNSKLVTVNPNPTTDHIRLDLTDFAGEAVTISIFGEQGRLVWENRIPAVEDLQLHISLRAAGAASGIYTVHVRSESGVVATRVVVVD